MSASSSDASQRDLSLLTWSKKGVRVRPPTLRHFWAPTDVGHWHQHNNFANQWLLWRLILGSLSHVQYIIYFSGSYLEWEGWSSSVTRPSSNSPRKCRRTCGTRNLLFATPDDRAVMISLISDVSCEWNGSSLGSGKHIDCNIVLGDVFKNGKCGRVSVSH